MPSPKPELRQRTYNSENQNSKNKSYQIWIKNNLTGFIIAPKAPDNK